MENNKIRSFTDLEVYKNTYQASLRVHREVLPKLPQKEKFDLVNQLSRSSKAIPRLIAEGYAKKHQKFGFQKYLDDALAECNETIVGLCHCRDIYNIDEKVCNELIFVYDISARQIYKLAEAWDKFKNRRRVNQNNNQAHTSSHT
ncbi:MAG: four helix bundle protein [Parcubacteria group bacterium]|nr:four helix bundle protein [Parcubacteria group bacterium]